MDFTRRGFLTSMLALSAAPAIVKADSLMKIVVPKRMGDGQVITIYGYRIGNGDQPVMEHIPEDPWVVEMQIEPVNQFTMDKWYSPPARLISSRPFVSARELNRGTGISTMDQVTERAVRELKINKRLFWR